METNTEELRNKATELSKERKFDEIITLLTDEVLKKQDDVELYVQRGNAWYYGNEDYQGAIEDYEKAIAINPNYVLAFYNRGLAWFAKKEYEKAIGDYTKVINFKPDDVDVYYTVRGDAYKAHKKYKEAIDDYTEAIKIKPGSENAYYSRGLARKEGKIDLKESKKDFEKYLELTIGTNDNSTKYAEYYIEDLGIRINDKKLSDIIDMVDKINNVLLYNDANCITHYTSLSTLKSLILDNSKFRISEGNFMNDPSEGNEFFKFLKPKTHPKVDFSPKPFIGCFVPEDKHDDLNMWRFYGKENGVEAKGCAITLVMHDLIDYIKGALSNERNKDARPDDESDIQFYRVAYITQKESDRFYISESDINISKKLNRLMKELKHKENSYQGNNRIHLEKYLNSIAFLFKNDAYKNENEVRLVVKGIGFPKEYNLNVGSLNVYIELASIKDIVKLITLGPKADTKDEWMLALNYSYEKKAPDIKLSCQPYR